MALSLVGAALPAKGADATVAGGPRFGKTQPFDFGRLQAMARTLAAKAYRPPKIRGREILETIDYDRYQKIAFRPPMALWADRSFRHPVQPFHLGRFFQSPVPISVVKDGRARELLYAPDLFQFDDLALARGLPENLGFAGFRVMHGHEDKRDWLAFLGASYFRSSGELDQYGLSARGVAIDTATDGPEEFPRFAGFWLEPLSRPDGALAIYALLDGLSVTGAYRIVAYRDGPVTTEVESRLFFRKAVKRLGVAPLTSMFWFDEGNRSKATDWRPEIHDSDGLAIWSGTGERIWRPLNNPSGVRVNSFTDDNPRGFGLLQRDRDFKNYEDDSVFYDRRPSVWVEPVGDWGKGAVQLVEIPTDDEIHDNIVTYWVPDEPVRAGSERMFSYRLHWVAQEPFPARSTGQVIATRIGRGGVPGQPRPKGRTKFAIDFEGGELSGLGKKENVKPVISASRGDIETPYALKVVGTGKWRAVFDLHAGGSDPINLRCFLTRDDRALSETWLYQFVPTDIPFNR